MRILSPSRKLLVIFVSAVFLSSALLVVLSPQEKNAVNKWEHTPSAEERIFPLFNRSNDLYVVNVSGEEADYSKQLAIVSLQGIVNRELSRIYVDFDGNSDRNSSLLSFLSSEYNLSLNRITSDEFFEQFIEYAKGIIVYDEGNANTVNIATILAGLEDCVIANPSLAKELHESYGLEVKYDLRDKPWSDLRDEVSIYDEALANLYPLCEKKLIAILSPEKVRSRDYVIATKSFVFYVPQGPLTSEDNMRFMEKVLKSTPRNIPILGWFPSFSGAEENFFVQKISRTGKMSLGGENFPNLSVLSSFQLTRPLQQSFCQRKIRLEKKIYLTLAIPDGDNIDFMNEKMKEIWNSEIRGRIPISWSIQPLLAELAPAYLKYIYEDATSNDTFLAAPSGAGYVYPNFMSNQDLDLYLWRAKRFLNETDLNIVWLLNSFTSYETPYSPAKLDAYAEVLRPEAMILDYGDTPVTRSYWIQSTESGIGIPVIRSTHVWGDIDNFIGKISMEAETYRARPHFIFVPIMPWTVNLEDVVEAVGILNQWYPDEFEIVSLNEFFGLFREAMIERANSQFVSLSEDPVAGVFAGALLDSANKEIGRAKEMQDNGDMGGAVAHASTAVAYLQEATTLTILIEVILIVTAIALLAVFQLWRKGITRPKKPQKLGHYFVILQLLFSLTLFYLGFLFVLYSNFWNYLNFLAIVIAIPVTLLLLRILAKVRKLNPVINFVASICLSLSTGLVFVHGLALGLVAISLLLIFSSKENEVSTLSGAEFLLIFLGSFILSSFLQMQLVVLVILSIWVLTFSIASCFVRKGPKLTPLNAKKENKGGTRRLVPSLVLSLLLILLLLPFVYPQNHYFSLVAGYNFSLLSSVSVLALLSSIIVGPILYKALPIRFGPLSSFSFVFAFSSLWFFAFLSPSAFFLCVVVLTTQLLAAVVFLHTYDRFGGKSSSSILSKYILLFVLFAFFCVMPPISYSLYLFPWSPSIVFLLYTPPLILSAFSSLVLLPLALSLWLK